MTNDANFKTPKRLLYVESNIDGTIGGSYYSLFFLVSGLDKAHFEPVVVFEAPNELTARFLSEGIKAIELTPRTPQKTKRKGLRPLIRVKNRVLAALHSLRSIVHHYQLLQKEKIALLHLNNSVEYGLPWLIAAKLAGIPCITHQRGIAKKSILTTLNSPRFDSIICISTAVRLSFEQLNYGHLPLVTIPNGLDPRNIKVTQSPSAIRQDLKIESNKRLVGIVANIQRWKGQHVVIDAIANALKECPDLVCLLIGAVSPVDPDDLKYNKEIETLIKAHNLQSKIIMTGYCSNPGNLINALEILIHASTQPEPFGRVILEGMALRKPVVASRAGGVPEIIIDGQSGFLYEPGNSQELSNCLIDLYHNPEKRTEIGNAGYTRLVDQFGIQHNVHATQTIYKSILKNVE